VIAAAVTAAAIRLAAGATGHARSIQAKERLAAVVTMIVPLATDLPGLAAGDTDVVGAAKIVATAIMVIVALAAGLAAFATGTMVLTVVVGNGPRPAGSEGEKAAGGKAGQDLAHLPPRGRARQRAGQAVNPLACHHPPPAPALVHAWSDPNPGRP